jgi:hypothetical protein
MQFKSLIGSGLSYDLGLLRRAKTQAVKTDPEIIYISIRDIKKYR